MRDTYMDRTTAHECHVDIPLENGKVMTVRIADIALLASDSTTGCQTLIVQGEGLLVTTKTYNQIRALINKIRPILALEPQESE